MSLLTEMERGTDAWPAFVRKAVRSGRVGEARRIPRCSRGPVLRAWCRPRSTTHGSSFERRGEASQREMGNQWPPDFAGGRSTRVCAAGKALVVSWAEGTFWLIQSKARQRCAVALGGQEKRSRRPGSSAVEEGATCALMQGVAVVEAICYAAIALDPCRGWGRHPLARIRAQKEPVVSPVGAGTEYHSTRRVSWCLVLLSRQGTRGPFIATLSRSICSCITDAGLVSLPVDPATCWRRARVAEGEGVLGSPRARGVRIDRGRYDGERGRQAISGSAAVFVRGCVWRWPAGHS